MGCSPVLFSRSARLRAMRRVVVLFSIALIVLFYGRTLGYGFDYDDYHFVRPYAVSEVGRSFVDRWDVSRIEAPFYRPLTISAFAVRAWILGSDPVRLHALSLFGLFV